MTLLHDGFCKACLRGNLNIGIYLHERFHIIPKKDELRDLYFLACYFRDLPRIKWLYYTFGKCKNMFSLLYHARDSESIVCFLFEKCGLDQNDIKKCSNPEIMREPLTQQEKRTLIQIYNKCFPLVA